jgi:hypothetical protein
MLVGGGNNVFVGWSSSDVSGVSALGLIDLAVLISPEFRVDVDASVDEEDSVARGGDGVNIFRNGDKGVICFIVGEGGEEDEQWNNPYFAGDSGDGMGGVGDAVRNVDVKFVFTFGRLCSFAVVMVECCDSFESRRGLEEFVGAVGLGDLTLLEAKKNFSPLSIDGGRLSGRSFAWKKLPVALVECTGVGERSLMKLGALFTFRGNGLISDLVLPLESDRSLVFSEDEGAKLGDCTLAFGATTNAGPKCGFSLLSDSSVFIRLRRSEERIVTVEGILLSILFVGVSYTRFVSAVSERPLIGVIRPDDCVPKLDRLARGLVALLEIPVLP